MTAADLRKLSRPELEALWLHLRADRLPVGTFDGVAWPSLPWRLGGPLWRGKQFDTRQPCWCGRADCDMVTGVRNRIGPWLLIPGDVTWVGDEVLIDYPQLHLQDRLKPVSETLWLGRMDLKWGTVWFSLEAVKN